MGRGCRSVPKNPPAPSPAFPSAQSVPQPAVRHPDPLTLKPFGVNLCNKPVTGSLNISPDRPVLVVPDVHQDLRFLQRASALAAQEGAGLVFLGDYVNTLDRRWRGEPAIHAIANALPELAETHSYGCLFLVGNRDVMALQIAYSRARQLLNGRTEWLATVPEARQPEANCATLLGAWPQTFFAQLAHRRHLPRFPAFPCRRSPPFPALGGRARHRRPDRRLHQTLHRGLVELARPRCRQPAFRGRSRSRR